MTTLLRGQYNRGETGVLEGWRVLHGDNSATPAPQTQPRGAA